MKEIKNNIGILIAALLGGIGIGFLIGHHSKGDVTAAPEKGAEKKAGFDGEEQSNFLFGNNNGNDDNKKNTQKEKHKATGLIINYVRGIKDDGGGQETETNERTGEVTNLGGDGTNAFVESKFKKEMGKLGYKSLANAITKLRDGVNGANNPKDNLVYQKAFPIEMKDLGYSEFSITTPIYSLVNEYPTVVPKKKAGLEYDSNYITPTQKDLLNTFNKTMISLGW